MRTKLVFWTAFNSYQSPKLLRGRPAGTPHPATTAAWTRRRVELFKRYNLPSILQQTYDDFYYVVLLDPELRHLTDQLLPNPVDERVLYTHVDGPTLSKLWDYDEIVLALIDSDDMYAKTAGEVMMRCRDEWMYFKRGYALNERTGAVTEYDTIHTGPFFAWRRKAKDMLWFDRDKRHPTHKAVADRNPTELAAGQFCVLLHNVNTSSHPGMRYVKQRPVNPKVWERQFGSIR